ncbi:MAG: hypothetical protein M3033_19605 [Acidobacteriota bacterium]|nr:hypothetical protein [Acidobacteriota bacterium]
MSNHKKISLSVLFVCLFFLKTSAQVKPLPGPEPMPGNDTPRQGQREENVFYKRNENSGGVPLNDSSRYVPIQPQLSKEERARVAALVAPNAEDAAKYVDFLRGKHTGLFRLFPDYGCESDEHIVRVDGDCADFVLESWNFTFRRKGYTNADYLDLRLKDGNFIGDGFLSQSILTRLGDVPLESVSAASDGVKFLFDFKPRTAFADAKKQYAEISAGIENGNFKYAKSVKAEVNQTYVLRAVAFRAPSDAIYRLSRRNARREDYKFVYLNYADKRADIIVAFRVVRREEKGNLTILWKRLDERGAPKIIFAKGEKLSDIKP